MEQFQRDSRERLYPSLRNPNWLILRRRRQVFEAGLYRLPRKSLRVLDIGGRLQPYRSLLGTRVATYVALDLQGSPLVSVRGQAEALPFRDQQFDFAICTQVLEYLPDPGVAIAEINRVLCKGGVLFLSAPSVYLRTSENECWRFLPAGLRYLLRSFDTAEVMAEGNSLIGFLRTWNVFVMAFSRPRILTLLLQWSVVPLLNLVGLVSARLGGDNFDFTANYSVWARK